MSLTKVQINLGTSGNLSGSRSLASSSLASRITTAEDELGNTLISSSAQLADDISGSFGSQRVGTSDSPTFNAITVGTATITGTLTAQEVHTEFESASILFTSGSTQFGNSSDDVHDFKGNTISGSATSTGSFGSVVVPGNVDVDGTTNLDNTDIDGTLTVDGGNIVFNEDSADQDFRVESNDNTHMFFVDGGNNRIGIGVGATPAFATLDIDAPGATNADNLDQSVDRATLRVRYRTDETDDGMFFGGLGSSAGYIQGVIDASNDNTSQAGKTIAINPYGGNVGIGINNPASNLVVSSSTKTDVLFGGNSSVFSDTNRSNVEINGQSTSTLGLTIGGAAKGLLLHDGTDSYFRNYANGYFAIYTNNSEKVRVDNSGNVGIGIGNPASKFHVSSSAAANANGVAQIHQAGGTNNPTLLVKQDVQGGNANDDQGLVVRVKGTAGGTGNSFHVYNRDDSGTGLVVKGSGDVGIGTNAPRDELDVVGNININGNGTRQIKFDDGAVSEGAIVFDEITNGFIFKVGGTSGAGKTDALHIENTGDIGIGTSSPLAKLHVEHTTDDTDENGNIAMTVGGGASGAVRHYWGINNSSNYAYYGAVEHGTQYVPLILQPNGSNVGIGTIAPAARLHVEDAHTNAPLVQFEFTGGGGKIVSFVTNGTENGDISEAAGTVSLNGFQGAHQTNISGSGDTSIKEGTVISTTDILYKQNHPQCKISDTENDTRVYGVFSRYVSGSSDFVVASVGVGAIRVTGSCAGGDLLVSAGDGCAKVNNSATLQTVIGKVTSNTSGSMTEDRLIPCVLYCG